MNKYTYAIEIRAYTYYEPQGYIQLPTFSRERAIESFDLMEKALKNTGNQLYLIEWDNTKRHKKRLKINENC